MLFVHYVLEKKKKKVWYLHTLDNIDADISVIGRYPTW